MLRRQPRRGTLRFPWRRLYIRLGQAVLLLAAYLFVTPYLLPDPGGPDIAPVRRAVAEADNGYRFVEQAHLAYFDSPPELREFPLRTEPPDAVMEYLEVNQPAIRLLEQAIAAPDLLVPDKSGEAPDPVYPLESRARGLARLKIQRGLLRAADGDLTGGLDDCLDVVTFGRRYQHGDGALIPYLVGVAIEQIGLRGVSDCLTALPWESNERTHRPPPALSEADRAALRRAAEAVAAPVDDVAAVRAALANQYQFARGSHAELWRFLSEGGDWDPPCRLTSAIYDSGQTRGLFRRRTREMMDLAAAPYAQRAVSASPELRSSCLVYNALGKAVVPDYRSAVSRRDQIAAYRRAVVTQIALRFYVEEHGTLPADLDDLITGGLLEAVPLDPYDGRPLRYDAARGLLWSVWNDRVDQGGVEAKTGEPSADLVWPVWFAGRE